MKETRFYQGLILILLMTLLLMFTQMDKNYQDVLGDNNTLLKVLEDNRTNYNENLEMMWDNYDSLSSDYIELESQYRGVEVCTYYFTEAEIYLVAQCVETEAGSSSDSQKYITQVLLNRLQSNKFPDSIEEVIYQKHNGVPQFSVAYDGRLDKCVPSNDTLLNVYSVIVGGSDLPEYIYYFYSARVKENWVNTLNTYKEVGGSVFAYSNKDKEDSENE